MHVRTWHTHTVTHITGSACSIWAHPDISLLIMYIQNLKFFLKAETSLYVAAFCVLQYNSPHQRRVCSERCSLWQRYQCHCCHCQCSLRP